MVSAEERPASYKLLGTPQSAIQPPLVIDIARVAGFHFLTPHPPLTDVSETPADDVPPCAPSSLLVALGLKPDQEFDDMLKIVQLRIATAFKVGAEQVVTNVSNWQAEFGQVGYGEVDPA